VLTTPLVSWYTGSPVTWIVTMPSVSSSSATLKPIFFQVTYIELSASAVSVIVAVPVVRSRTFWSGSRKARGRHKVRRLRAPEGAPHELENAPEADETAWPHPTLFSTLASQKRAP